LNKTLTISSLIKLISLYKSNSEYPLIVSLAIKCLDKFRKIISKIKDKLDNNTIFISLYNFFFDFSQTNKNLETKNENNFSQKIFNNIILLENERNKNIDAIEKIEEQFYFKRDDEAQKKRQIESVLDIDKRKPIYDHLGNMVIKKRKLYKSIFLNKYMNKVLNYCYDNVRDQIITEKVNDQEENAENIGKSLNPIKFNFN
jgi:hypothetical protein